MKFGVSATWILGKTPTAAEYFAFAKKAEDLGYSSISIGDHVAIPTEFDASKYPMGLLWPDTLWHDPFVFLAAIAAVTTRISLITSVAVVPYRTPITQAQEIATLDYMSGGRFIFGIGLGWMKEEFDMLGVPHNERGARTDECMRVMQQLWAGDTKPFKGRFFSHPGALLSPLPIQKKIPIYVGGEGGLPNLKRCAEIGDGFYGAYRSPNDFRAQLDMLKPLLAERGRSMSEIKVSMGCLQPVITQLLQNSDEIRELDELGVDELLLAPVCNSPEEGMKLLDTFKERFFD